jgi:hypothetical protein
MFGGFCQQIADQLFELIRVFQIDFDGGAEDFELDFPVFGDDVSDPFFESVHADAIDLFCIFCEDPYTGFLGFAVGGMIEQCDEVHEHVIVVVFGGVFPQYVLHGLNSVGGTMSSSLTI